LPWVAVAVDTLAENGAGAMQFDWDDANRQHISEHRVSCDEVEYVVNHGPWDVEVQIVESEERYVQLGATNRGRVLAVISTVRGPLIRVVTAYDASRRQRLMYEQWRGESYGTEVEGP
jgi:uncharacterized DUF497 family protein